MRSEDIHNLQALLRRENLTLLREIDDPLLCLDVAFLVSCDPSLGSCNARTCGEDSARTSRPINLRSVGVLLRRQCPSIGVLGRSIGSHWRSPLSPTIFSPRVITVESFYSSEDSLDSFSPLTSSSSSNSSAVRASSAAAAITSASCSSAHSLLPSASNTLKPSSESPLAT